MCFVKSAPVSVPATVEPVKVERHQADAAQTKNSAIDDRPRGFLQNLKTSPYGLEDTARTEKKTLLGE